ncbi:decaprenyl-phosphate phosphoribosyltransferase [Sphaerisporangium sp. TRM90804]|uniref:decaprenyl-phosphate phosphoribosyltransferase n=1 Tax=Sphaerisporangium sp. TRM90804 TaxID=3031113 RepID=UPI0024496184|nr:decaprenyl-phosphate phosphoribosyltransferase [Sphaerisporangium sp. TRM90804]MDH2427908.1 decaprenyl-phosphate phosphoribosyltransferase [Sphaerisporangium sp. TRM90804]
MPHVPQQAVAGGVPLARPGLARGLLTACRPRQWLKNVLVTAAPLASATLFTPFGLWRTAVAFVAFCLAASGAYLLNDAADAARDRLHPVKRHRPVAAGVVPVRLARVLGVALMALAPVAAAATGGWKLPAVVAGYVVLAVSYTFWLKHQVVVDLVAVAGCHVVRAFAGAVAVEVPATSWFLVVISLGSLQVVAGKRQVELAVNGTAGTRGTLAGYSAAYLSQVRSIASGAMIVTYCLWALRQGTGAAAVAYAASIVPFLLIVLRHNLLVDRGAGEEPEELALRDRPLQVFIGLLALALAAGIHVLPQVELVSINFVAGW